MAMLVLATGFLSACSDDDDDNQSGAVILESFGPSPALRGGQLTFVGQNLDKVTSVVLPNDIEIKNIEVITRERIKITIPQDAKVGYIKLIAPGVELSSKTVLAYKEPISISSIAPSPVKAGQKVTIQGEYLNLIERVIFNGNVEVKSEDFITWERAKIELLLPREAKSGTITLADMATIPVELVSEMELQVVLPSVVNVADLTNKKPGDLITIPGADLDLVEKVELPDGTAVEFTVADNALSFTLPEGATDGALVMIAYSGVKIAIANIGMAIPASLVATPATDIKAGDLIKIEGVNMELVTSVTFPGVATPVVPASKTATEITVTMPDMATSGNLILHTASGNTASVAISTLKPEVLAYNPNPVAAGSEVVLQGKHLDLVASVTFGGNKTVTASTTNETELTITVPVDAESGQLTLTMKNGETVTAPHLDVTKPVFCYIPVLPDPAQEINAGTILSIAVQNGDKLTNVQVNGANTQYILQSTNLNVLIPSNAGGKTMLTLISSNGEVTYTITVIGAGVTETEVFKGPLMITWGDGGRAMVMESAFTDVPAGAILKIYFTQTENWGQVQINNGNWATMKFGELNNDGYIKTDMLNDKSITSMELALTADVLSNIRSNFKDGNAIIIQGSDFIIDKITIITKGGGSAKTKRFNISQWN